MFLRRKLFGCWLQKPVVGAPHDLRHKDYAGDGVLGMFIIAFSPPWHVSLIRGFQTEIFVYRWGGVNSWT